ncbi:MAG: TonB-dependent receptor [Prolixibacteraceae bacterium]|nr:TonB-dependent receptor [Prolixibacteraceae bacterium]
MKYITLLFSLFIAPLVLLAQSFTISGFINDKTNGETLIGAAVQVMNKAVRGTTSNEYGFYSITLPQGSYELAYSFIGYQEQTINISLTENKTINIGLEEFSTNIGEVVVSASSVNEKISQSKMGVEKVNVGTISKLPVLFGEKDILKTMQLLPGVKSGGDGQSGFTVRGGSIDQNLILLDDAPVYNASHLLGFFSTFNSDAIKDVTLYKGTAPAQFGGRISSVVDVKMNEGDNQNYGVSGGIGLISSKLNIEGPVQKGKSSFLITGRRTYADIFLKLTDQFKDNNLSFYDLNAKFNYHLSDKDRLFVSGYFGRDRLGLNNRFGIDWGNATATLRWNHLFNSKLFSNTSFIYSNYDYNIDIQNNVNPFSILSRIRDWNVKQEFQYFSNAKNEWKFGYNIIYHAITPGQITNEESTDNPYQLRDGIESAIYATNDWQATDKLKINYGLRLSNFIVLGGSDYYTLDDNKNITDTIRQSNPVKSYLNFEPRLSLSYTLNKNSSLKVAYTRNTQNMHLITNSVTTNPTDKWIMNTNIIKPEIGDQVSLGYFHNLKENMFEFSAETYYKSMQNQIDYKDNADERAPAIETQLLYGKGRAYGLELLLKKNQGKLTGWLGYTLSRTEKQIDGINQNQWYAARQDRTHDISIVTMYDISKRWNVSAVWVYQTGNAITFPSGKYEVAGQTTWLYTERNGYRMPAYHRLDLGATFKLKERKRFNSELSFGLYNAYGRENPYTITFEQSDTDPNKTVAVQTSLFRWIPSVSWNFKFK